MKAKFIRTMACVVAVLLIAPETSDAQDQNNATPPDNVMTPTPDAPAAAPQSEPVFRPEELEQMLAPIALYPDQLLAQVLMAATYPLEVIQAERWVKDQAHAKLKGDQLTAALDGQSWDPSVKSLVQFPQILQMMSDKLDWTQRLGDAVLAQQEDVMASVQRLRQEAQAAGTLASNEQQVVVIEKKTVVIQPANPATVYVPVYNPAVVYGTWPYPAYPPVYYPPPPAYYPYASGAAFATGVAFASGVIVANSLWGWGNCNWNTGHVNVNVNHYNSINAVNINNGRATTLPANANAWRHDPSHRAGVPYRDTATRQTYQRQAAIPPAERRDLRGYEGSQKTVGQGTSRPPAGTSAIGQRQPSAGGSVRQPATAATATGTRKPTGTGAARPSSAPRQPATGTTPTGARKQYGTGTGTARPSSAQGQPAAFQGMGNGADVRAQADRGRASQQSPAATGPRSSAPASRATPTGGGARASGGLRR